MDTIYCNVRVSRSRIEILIFNKLFNKYPLCIVGSNSNNLFALIIRCNDIAYLSFYHILYLGKEISKAEIAVLIEQNYIQE